MKNFATGIPSVAPRIADNPFQIRTFRGEMLPKTTGRERGKKAALARKFCDLVVDQRRRARIPHLHIRRTAYLAYAVSGHR